MRVAFFAMPCQVQPAQKPSNRRHTYFFSRACMRAQGGWEGGGATRVGVFAVGARCCGTTSKQFLFSSNCVFQRNKQPTTGLPLLYY